MLRPITAPTLEPVSLAEAKAALRYASADTTFDVTIASLLKAARQELDGANGRLRRALLTQTWEKLYDDFPTDGFEIPLPPLQSVASIVYRDADGATQTLDSGAYRLVSHGDAPSWIEPVDAWPSVKAGAGAVVLRFVAGWASAADVPDPIKVWIIARAGAVLAQPESVVVGVAASPVQYFDRLLDAYQVYFT